MEIPSNYPKSMPKLKCLTPITTHPAINIDGQIAIPSKTSEIKSAFNPNNFDLLSSLSIIFEEKGRNIKGNELKVFKKQDFLNERIHFLAN
jgi:ubiquitin-protein ligase